jgi:hypothetical protein
MACTLSLIHVAPLSKLTANLKLEGPPVSLLVAVSKLVIYNSCPVVGLSFTYRRGPDELYAVQLVLSASVLIPPVEQKGAIVVKPVN